MASSILILSMLLIFEIICLFKLDESILSKSNIVIFSNPLLTNPSNTYPPTPPTPNIAICFLEYLFILFKKIQNLKPLEILVKDKCIKIKKK